MARVVSVGSPGRGESFLGSIETSGTAEIGGRRGEARPVCEQQHTLFVCERCKHRRALSSSPESDNGYRHPWPACWAETKTGGTAFAVKRRSSGKTVAEATTEHRSPCQK